MHSIKGCDYCNLHQKSSPATIKLFTLIVLLVQAKILVLEYSVIYSGSFYRATNVDRCGSAHVRCTSLGLTAVFHV